MGIRYKSGSDPDRASIDEEFLLRPVAAGMCSYMDLKNGNLTLLDIAIMNDFLDCQEWNKR